MNSYSSYEKYDRFANSFRLIRLSEQRITSASHFVEYLVHNLGEIPHSSMLDLHDITTPTC